MDSVAEGSEALRMLLSERAPHREPLPAGAVRAAVALVLSGPVARRELLLIRRAVRVGDPWSGHVALPGGRFDPSDRDLAETARRETFEETAVVLPGPLGELDDLRPTRSRNPRIVVRPFVFLVPERPPVRVDAREVAYHRWVDLSELAAAAGHGRIELGGEQHLVPGFQLGEDFVWGMTHRILGPFLSLALPDREHRT